MTGQSVMTSAKIAAIIFMIALFSWVYADVPLINPFVAFLGLVACLFFYGIGRLKMQRGV